MVDIEKVLKTTVKKGNVKIGSKQTKQVISDGTAKLIVFANNSPYSSEITTLAKKKKIPIYTCDSNSINLGNTCGKSFAVSVFAVIEEGGSNILNLVNKR